MSKKQKSGFDDIYNDYLNTELDSLEKSSGIARNSFDEKGRLSSGILVMDMVMGGGMVPGMYVISGLEASGKSTSILEYLKASIDQEVPLRMYFDAEGTATSDLKYAARIFHTSDMSNVFGQNSSKGWVIKPKLRYYNDSIMETIFESIRSALKMLPDKTYLKETKKWYYVFSRKKDDMDKMKRLGLEPDKDLFTRYGKYYCEASHAGPEAFIAVDSLPNLVLSAVDEEETEGNQLGLLAGAYAKWLPRIKGYMKRKAAVWVGVNLIGEKPMARGNPFYEKSGNAIRSNSDVRLQVWSRATPDTFTKGVDENGNSTSMWCVEPSVTGKNQDHYVFKQITNVKNKTGVPYRKGWMRICIKDAFGVGTGVDPVYDTFQYLRMTGQLSGSIAKGFTISLPCCKGISFGKKSKGVNEGWMKFKKFILDEDSPGRYLTEAEKAAKKKGKKLVKNNPGIRKACFVQIYSGEAAELYTAALSKHKTVEDEE